MAEHTDTPPTNCLLDALPAADRARLTPSLEVVPLELKEYVHGPGVPISHVYFPATGFCSVVTVLHDGRMVEITTVGREGAIGTMAATDGTRPSTVVMVQAPMPICYRLPMAKFQEEMREKAFAKLIADYNDAMVGTIMQGSACNAVHGVEMRLARWLLMAHDRVGQDRFQLTQEFVAMMLGVSRPTVTVIARGLQASGLITYHRGRLTVHDRDGLEKAACECYRAMTAELRAVSDVICLPESVAAS